MKRRLLVLSVALLWRFKLCVISFRFTIARTYLHVCGPIIPFSHFPFCSKLEQICQNEPATSSTLPTEQNAIYLFYNFLSVCILFSNIITLVTGKPVQLSKNNHAYIFVYSTHFVLQISFAATCRTPSHIKNLELKDGVNTSLPMHSLTAGI